MPFISANIKVVERCAFCKYWYDPTNSYITPKSPSINLWGFDTKAKCKCLKRNYEMSAGSCCPHYELKLPINK